MGAEAEVFAPGEFLKEEIDARGWAQIELAEIIGRPARLINEIIAGKRAITPETAIQLGQALGTSAELWLNLESQFQLSKVKTGSDLVSRRANLYSLFPVREMIKRSWVEFNENIEVLEQEFLNYFSIKTFQEKPVFCHAAKKTNADDSLTLNQLAWLIRSKNIATRFVVPTYKKSKLIDALPRLQALLSAPEEIRHVGTILSEAGVRLVFVESLPGSKIDGACFWINNTQPVISMSLRLDRIDNFWFVLRHEIEHVLQEHGKEAGYIIDQEVDIENSDTQEEEKIANEASADFNVNQAELTGFIARVKPYFSEDRVCLFAQRIGVHPGIVVGQLQRRLKRFDFLRKHQVKVREIVIKSNPTDGWGVFQNF